MKTYKTSNVTGDEREFETEVKRIGGISVTFEAEKYPNTPLADTNVWVSDQVLCAISWDKREEFFKELKEIVQKYAL